MKGFVFLVWIMAVVTAGHGSLSADVKVDADFSGGSVVVEELDEDERRLRFRPMAYPYKGWACWWHFKVTGLRADETWKFALNGSGFAAPARASLSVDGKNWRHTEKGSRAGKLLTYELVVPAETLWLAWGPPFTLADSQALVEKVAQADVGAKAFELCKSNEGLSVPALKWEPEGGAEQPVLWIQARQHAWESGSSWVCRGFVEWLASENQTARAMREKARVYVAPVMDADNVERGAGGKNQTPHDHNRDWGDKPRYAEVAAAQAWIRLLNEKRNFTLFLDLHNPGPGDAKPFFFGSPESHLSSVRKKNQARLHTLCMEIMGRHPFGFSEKIRVTGKSYHPLWRRISKNWVAENVVPSAVALTLETTWNSPHSTQQGYLAFGAALGEAIGRYVLERSDEGE